MADLKLSALWALLGAMLVLFAFGVSWVTESAIPGYTIMAYPGILVASHFSEEINFWPKLGLMVLGQYLVYFAIISAIRWALKLGTQK